MLKKILVISAFCFISNASACDWGKCLSAVKDAASWVGHMSGDMAHDWRDNANSGNTQWHKDLANATSNTIDYVTTHAGNAWDKMQAEKK